MRDLVAVISTAGFGSRFFPLSKAVAKVMLPILTRPVIDYVVEDCVRAGARRIILVVPSGDTQIRRYFEEDLTLHRYFQARGWGDKYQPVQDLHDRYDSVQFNWIEQPANGRYGTAVPPMLAREHVGDADFLLVTGDDVVLRADGGSELLHLVEARDSAGSDGAIAVTEVPRAMVSRYGIIQTRDNSGHVLLDGAVEKPQPRDAPSQLASVSRFLMTPDVFGYLDRLQPDPTTNEFYSITALVDYARDHPVVVHKIAGTYYDCGTADGWLAANLAARRVVSGED